MNFSARLQREWSKLRAVKASKGPEEELEVDLSPRSELDLNLWTASIRGPPDSPFEDHLFQLRLSIPPRYPLQPPKVFFVTRVCHPNVHFKTGEICLDVLKDQWTPSYTLESLCRTIIQLLSHPAADSPLNCDSGNMIRAGDLAAYWDMARMYTLDYATPTPQFLEKMRKAQQHKQQQQQQQEYLNQTTVEPSAVDPEQKESSTISGNMDLVDDEEKSQAGSTISSLSTSSFVEVSPTAARNLPLSTPSQATNDVFVQTN